MVREPGGIATEHRRDSNEDQDDRGQDKPRVPGSSLEPQYRARTKPQKMRERKEQGRGYELEAHKFKTQRLTPQRNYKAPKR